MRLESRLGVWAEKGLISSDQAHAIREFEESERRTSRHWTAWALAALGGLAILTGVIAVVSSHWDEIPDAVKLATAFVLLMSTLAGALRLSKTRATWVRDLLLFLHDGLVLATIGLVAQIFHISGAPWRPFAITAAFSLPAAIIAGSSLLMDVFIILGLTAVLMRLSEVNALVWWNTQMVLFAAALVLVLSWEAVRRFGLPLVNALKRWGAILIAVAVAWEAGVWAYPGFGFDTPRFGPIQWTLT